MNKQLLSVLGCSGSIALSLVGASSAEANTTNEYIFKAPETSAELSEAPRSEIDYPFYDCSCSEYDSATLEKVDQQGDRAIAAYGCDCAGCRRLVGSLGKVKKGQLNSYSKSDNLKD